RGSPAQAQQVETTKQLVPARLPPPLPVKLDGGEVAGKQRSEIGAAKLALVKWVLRPVRRVGDMRRREHERSGGPQHADNLRKEPLMVAQVLEHLKRRDDVEARVLEVEREQVADAKYKIRPRIAS